MNIVNAKFKIVTPLFISGADQTKAELRVPSIKGALRFWWRALNYHANANELSKIEGNIFGSSDKEIGQSKILIRLMGQNLEAKKIQRKWDTKDWESYIGFGLSEEQKKDRSATGKYREFFKPGGDFSISIESKPRTDDESKSRFDVESVINSLKLFGLVGGLGSRSRNGWGSIAITEFDNDIENDIEKWKIPKTREEYRIELKSLINPVSLPEQRPDYSALSKKMMVKVGKSFDSYEKAFSDIATNYKGIVCRFPKTNREDFGLPRKSVSNERRASPLMIHIHQSGNEFYWVCLFIDAKFLPSRNAADDYDAVREFMNQIGGEAL